MVYKSYNVLYIEYLYVYILIYKINIGRYEYQNNNRRSRSLLTKSLKKLVLLEFQLRI